MFEGKGGSKTLSTTATKLWAHNFLPPGGTGHYERFKLNIWEQATLNGEYVLAHYIKILHL